MASHRAKTTGVISCWTAVLLLPCAKATAHGFAVYVSTPVSPPIGFRWVIPLALLTLCLVNLLGFRYLMRRRWPASVILALVVPAVFCWVFIAYGRMATRLSTAPEPGLGSPAHVFWGWGLEKVGPLFAWWNLLGLAFLLSIAVAGAGLVRIPRRVRDLLFIGVMTLGILVVVVLLAWWNLLGLIFLLSIAVTGAGLVPISQRVREFLSIGVMTSGILVVLGLFGAEDQGWAMAALAVFSAELLAIAARAKWISLRRVALLLLANAAAYLVWVSPFACTGAWTHGWYGSYVHRACRNRLELLSRGLAMYARGHGGMLPDAKSIEDLMPQAKPYVPQHRIRFDSPLEVCPVVDAYEEPPKPYIWNARYAGQHGSLICQAARQGSSDPSAWPLACPGHVGGGFETLSWFEEEFTDTPGGPSTLD